MICTSCGNSIPSKRVSMGFKTCIQCSTVDKYGAVNIIYHKTGNTIQVTDQETSKRMSKLGDRKRFGSVLKRGSSGGYNPKNVKIGCSTVQIGSDVSYTAVGERAMFYFETFGYDKAISTIDKAQKDYEINTSQANKLKQLFTTLNSVK